MIFHFKFLKVRLTCGKGGISMVDPGRHLASLRHWPRGWALRV